MVEAYFTFVLSTKRSRQKITLTCRGEGGVVKRTPTQKRIIITRSNVINIVIMFSSIIRRHYHVFVFRFTFLRVRISERELFNSTVFVVVRHRPLFRRNENRNRYNNNIPTERFRIETISFFFFKQFPYNVRCFVICAYNINGLVFDASAILIRKYINGKNCSIFKRNDGKNVYLLGTVRNSD